MDPVDSDMSDRPAYDLSREPEILPRVGDAYQVEFPQPVSRSEYLLLLRSIEDAQSGAKECFVGLSVPVLPLSKDHGSKKGGNAKVQGSSSRTRKGTDGSDLGIVPLSELASWTDMERSSFLVGLYIFQKNFVQLTGFIKTKSTGDIMSYYYGKFYRSQEYSRWSDGRKVRSKRCIFGQKIFTGARLQELLARFFNNVSEDSQNDLIEVSRTFGEGRMPLPEYVSVLKGITGLDMFVEAFSIGKGKQDLTSTGFEPSRASQSIQIRPEIPTGKACANLTVSQIVGYLTGDYRKSKAKSNDLFWEAVWPRLLARGWHSEEAKDPGYPVVINPKTIVFLVPGVKHFSRRRLVRGSHFFDSISDVLGKVARDPSLMELDTEGDEMKKRQEGTGAQNDIMLEEDDAPTRSRRNYLQPRTTTRISAGMKFTIADSSSDGERAYMLKELKIPEELNKPDPRNLIRVGDQDTPKVAVDTALSKKQGKHERVSQATADLVNKRGIQISDTMQESKSSSRGSERMPVNNSRRTDNLEDKPHKKAARKRVLSQSTKEEDVPDTRPVNKRARRLTVCNQLETSNFTEKAAIIPASEAKLPSESTDISSLEENVPTQAPSLIKAYLSDANDVERDRVVSESDRSSHNQPLIDLNIAPQVPVDYENDVLMEDASAASSEVNVEPDMAVASSDQQQVNSNQQRRGTRNRPPTSKALEALANGLLTVNSRQKGGPGGSRSRSAPRPSRHARGIARLGIGKTPLAPIPEESKTPSASSTPQGGQSAAGSDPDKVQPGEFEVLSRAQGAPASGN